MAIQHKKAYGIYHWDTFYNDTILIEEADTKEEAISKVEELYENRIRPDGADQVWILNQQGTLVEKFKVR